MIVAIVEGGLGNQLFIYAGSRALASRLGIPLKIDTVSGYLNDEYGRKYRLDNFSIRAEKSLPGESIDNWFLNKKRKSLIRSNRYLPWRFKNFIIKKKGFCPSILSFKTFRSKIYLEGYWQDERYFQSCEPDIRRDLQLKSGPSEPLIDLAASVDFENAVCIHIRQQRYEFPLKWDYYERAIALVKTKISKPEFYLFGDDPEWFKKHFNDSSSVTYMPMNGNELEDFWLMQQYQNFIIANSSFSWWTSWLSNHETKIVIAPKNWGYKGGSFHNSIQI